MRRLLLLTLAAATLAAPGVASAEWGRNPGVRYGNCHWRGTSPACNGRCEPGFYVRGFKGCMIGYKVLCCEPMGTISQPLRR